MGKVRRSTVTVKVTTTGPATVTVRIKQGEAEGRQPLRFGNGNAKLDKAIFTFSLPAGHYCPHAKACKAKANRETGKITDGPDIEYRCFSADTEARWKSVRDHRWRNAELLRGKTQAAMTTLILDSLSPFAGYVRLHVAGDFFSQDYFDAWLSVALQRPPTLFYAYTKALPFWLKRREDLPSNLILTASYGGTHDHLIEPHGLRSAVVVKNARMAERLGLELDHDDSHAMGHGPSFALLVHGSQPAGSEAARDVAALRKQGEYGYGERADEIRRERHALAVLN